MSALLQFVTEDGSAVLVEIAEPAGVPVTRGGRSSALVLEASESLDGVVSRVGAVVRSVMSQLRATAEWPDAMEIDFAVKLSADSNVIIARAGGEANFRIALKWSNNKVS